MSTFVTKFYPRTVIQSFNELEVEEAIKSLIETCVDSSGKFNDPEFGPTPSDPKGECSIFYPPDESVKLQGDSEVGALNNIAGLGIDLISWLRPREFCKDPSKCAFMTFSESDSSSDEEPSSVDGDLPKNDVNAINDKSRGASCLDVMQGNLGDCWFISAMALVALRDDLLGNLICEDRFLGTEKYGLYVFRMFRNCKVLYVIIDDKIPCMERSNGHCIPAFARCRNPDEFWVSMIEKAYAKLNIRYINLTSGFIDEALQDMTGLAPEMIRFTADTEKEAFWKNFKELSYSQSLIGASLNFLGRKDIPDELKRELQTEARHHGIQYGHAYGVLDIREVEDPADSSVIYRFLRIKNPWGKDNQMEWNGDWCDSDPNWTDELKKRYNDAASAHPKFDKEEMEFVWGRNDNIFIMEFHDFMTYFNTIMDVRDFAAEWSGIRFFTMWSPSYGIPPRGKTWYKNPQFAFYLKNTTDLELTLQQPDPRSIAENRPPFKKLVMLIVVFKIDNAEHSVQEFDPKKIVLQSQGSDSRSVMISGNLKAGKYCAILFNAVEGSVSECFFSVYFNCSKEDILFENKNWELIKEEEEDVSFKKEPRKASESLETGKKLPERNLIQLSETSKKTEETQAFNQPEPAIKGDQSNLISKKAEESKQVIKKPENNTIIKDPKETQKTLDSTGKKPDASKSLTPSKPTPIKTDAKPAKTYTQAIKELKQNISTTGTEEEVMIPDPLILEIQFENEMANLLGINYSDYKSFYTLPSEEQQKIIDQYNIDKNRTATVLDLNYYGLGPKGLMASFHGIEDFHNLEYLYLRSNKLNDTIICELCRRLDLSRQLGLKELDLSENPDVGDISGQALYTLASKFKNLVKIALESTSVTVKILQKVNDQLEKNKKLKKS